MAYLAATVTDIQFDTENELTLNEEFELENYYTGRTYLCSDLGYLYSEIIDDCGWMIRNIHYSAS